MTRSDTLQWIAIAAVAITLGGVFLSIGYGLIGVFVLFILVAMGGGALLYWLDGESER